MLRDGYNDARVKVTIKNDQVMAMIDGERDDYSQTIQKFLNIGQIGYINAQELKAANKWQNDWYFFLPLGFAMRNNPTVQLLHFPPLTVMTQTQDYLQAATTIRWASLLKVNGVSLNDTFRYQTIVDIALIAAPSNAGAALEGVYDYFSNYTVALLELWLAYSRNRSSKSMIAFGAPARQWLAKQYKLTSIDVLELKNLQLTVDYMVPTLGSNHPSRIWYASDPRNYNGSEEKANAVGLNIMNEDLIVSCWQATMGAQPWSNPAAALDKCKKKWPGNSTLACELFYTSIRQLKQEEAQIKCAVSRAHKNGDFNIYFPMMTAFLFLYV
jgi:hypothetical protein